MYKLLKFAHSLTFKFYMIETLCPEFILNKYQPQLSNKLLLAHSGGVDSSVLCAILKDLNCNFSIAHCNFKLRGAESDIQAYHIKAWCASHGISCYYQDFATKAHMKYSGKNVQLATRELRYKWFKILMEIHGFQYLLTAHHLNDQLETFLINSFRGTGITGLKGMPNNHDILRPLLSFSKSQIIKYAQKNQIEWLEDSSNNDLSYKRNFIRHQVVKTILDNEPKTIYNFKKTINYLAQTYDFVTQTTDDIRKTVSRKEDSLEYFNISIMRKLKHQEFLFFCWFNPLGFDVKEVLKLVATTSGKNLFSKSHRLTRTRKYLILSEKGILRVDEEKIKLDIESIAKIHQPFEMQWESINQLPTKPFPVNKAYLDLEKIGHDLYLGKNKPGQYFYPTSMKGKKSLSKYFRDLKLNEFQKVNQWILYRGNQVIWVVGKRVDRRFAATDSTNNILMLELLK